MEKLDEIVSGALRKAVKHHPQIVDQLRAKLDALTNVPDEPIEGVQATLTTLRRTLSNLVARQAAEEDETIAAALNDAISSTARQVEATERVLSTVVDRQRTLDAKRAYLASVESTLTSYAEADKATVARELGLTVKLMPGGESTMVWLFDDSRAFDAFMFFYRIRMHVPDGPDQIVLRTAKGGIGGSASDTSITRRHWSSVRSSSGTAGAPVPALLNSRSIRPNARSAASNRAWTDSGSVTSVGTAIARDRAWPARSTVSSRASRRRPASATEYPSASNARAVTRPIPDPAPVTIAAFPLGTIGLPPSSPSR
jgi:hypothetical protein